MPVSVPALHVIGKSPKAGLAAFGADGEIVARSGKLGVSA